MARSAGVQFSDQSRQWAVVAEGQELRVLTVPAVVVERDLLLVPVPEVLELCITTVVPTRSMQTVLPVVVEEPVQLELRRQELLLVPVVPDMPIRAFLPLYTLVVEVVPRLVLRPWALVKMVVEMENLMPLVGMPQLIPVVGAEAGVRTRLRRIMVGPGARA